MTQPNDAASRLHAYFTAGPLDRVKWMPSEEIVVLLKAALAAARQQGAAEAVDMDALRTAFHDTRWCKDAARGHAFAHGDDPEDDAARQAFLDAYRAAILDAEAAR